jgi:hypothetical protein
MDSLREIVKRYIQAKIKMTKCMQIHFKQLCHTCKEFNTGCNTYSAYCEVWMELQRKVNGE